MVPQTEANLKIDPHQRAIWGHSYGGLFVLDAWRKASPFGIYYSASPSLGQALQSPLQASQSLDAVRFRGKSLYLLEGDGKARGEPSGHEARLRCCVKPNSSLPVKG